jgi:hypothetical protein
MASANKLAVRPQSSVGSRRTGRDGALTKWQSAGDAIVAASRLRTQIVPRGADAATNAQVSAQLPSALGTRGSTAVVSVDGVSAQKSNHQHQQLLARYGSAAREAAKTGDAMKLRQLINAQPGAHDHPDENLVVPLHLAAAYGHMACVEMICDAGASLDRANAWGSTSLINAAHNAQAGIVRLLILNGASMQTRDRDGTALDNALKRMQKLIRNLGAALDKDHPDKPVLRAASDSLSKLVMDPQRGREFKEALEKVLGKLRPLIATALAAGADATDAQPNGGKKDADAGDPPAPGLVALYSGCHQYVRCIEMLRGARVASHATGPLHIARESPLHPCRLPAC